MTRKRRSVWLIVLMVILLPIGAVGGEALWYLSRGEVFDHPLTERSLIPVACSLRGCITARTWHAHWRAQQSFAEIAGQGSVRPVEALTTAMRQHLVEHAFVRPVVNKKDAIKYREEILRINNEDKVKEVTGLSVDDYDDMVILPLLQQEALRQQLRVESLDELYMLLAEDRWVAVLPLALKWDREQAKVVAR